jgi:hypothetical protein
MRVDVQGDFNAFVTESLLHNGRRARQPRGAERHRCVGARVEHNRLYLSPGVAPLFVRLIAMSALLLIGYGDMLALSTPNHARRSRRIASRSLVNWSVAVL